MDTISTDGYQDARQRLTVHIDRPVLSQSEFEDLYLDKEKDADAKDQHPCRRFGDQLKEKVQKMLPPSFKDFILRLFPFITIMSNYNWKEDTIRDLIAGATVAFLHVPQAMAYGQLATLRPIHGLYVAFFPGIIYFFLGTSRQLSIGVFAVASLMVAKALDAEIATGEYGLPVPADMLMQKSLGADNATIVDEVNGTALKQEDPFDFEAEELRLRVEIATSYNIVVGFIQVKK